MRAVPTLDAHGAEKTSGISCPDCPGVLAASRSERYLGFRCRIGHAYSLKDLIVAKEVRLEEALWAPITALEELATILEDLLSQDRARIPSKRSILERRVAAARRHASAIRAIIEESEPTALGDESEGKQEIV